MLNSLVCDYFHETTVFLLSTPYIIQEDYFDNIVVVKHYQYV